MKILHAWTRLSHMKKPAGGAGLDPIEAIHHVSLEEAECAGFEIVSLDKWARRWTEFFSDAVQALPTITTDIAHTSDGYAMVRADGQVVLHPSGTRRAYLDGKPWMAVPNSAVHNQSDSERSTV